MFQTRNWWTMSRCWLGLGGFKETIGGNCHVFGSVLGGFKETIDGFMSHVENSSSWGDGGMGDGGDGGWGGWWANPDLSERHSGIGRVWSAVLVFRLSSSVFSLNRD